MNRVLRKWMSSEVPYILLAFILPLTYTGLWLLINTQLPGNDAANYLMAAVDIFHRFSDHGFWSGIQSAYLDRGWRPIFFPLFAVPFLLVSHGNLYFAYSAVAIFCMVTSVTYIYLFFRLKLDRYSAIIATSLVGLLPFIQAQAVMFYAEAALFPCIIGCVYHLIKSDYLRDKSHVYGFIVLLALAFVIRPVEAATHLIFVLSLFLFLGWHRHYFSPRQIISVMAISLSALCVMFFLTALPYIHFTPVHVMDGAALDKKMAKIIRGGLIAIGTSTLLMWVILASAKIKEFGSHCWRSVKSNSDRTLLVPAFFMAFTLVLFWFMPAAFETFQWVYRTSLGDVASSTGSLSGSHFSWDVLQIYVREEGILPIIGVVLLTAIGFACLSKLQRRSIIISKPFIFLLLLAPFPLWEAFYTVQIVTRKLSIAVPAVLMALLLLALQRGNGWLLRIIGMTLLTCALFGLCMYLMVTPQLQNPVSLIKNTVGYFVPQPARLKPNPHDVVIDFLTTQAAKYHLISIGIELNPGTPDARHPLEAEPVDPFLVSTMVVAAKQHYSVSYPYFSIYSPDNVQNLGERYDGIFLSDSANHMVITTSAAEAYSQQYLTENSPSLKTLYEFLMYYSKNKLMNKGWVVGPCISVKTARHGEYVGCLLLRKK